MALKNTVWMYVRLRIPIEMITHKDEYLNIDYLASIEAVYRDEIPAKFLGCWHIFALALVLAIPIFTI